LATLMRRDRDSTRIREAVNAAQISSVSKESLIKRLTELAERRSPEDAEITTAITEAQSYEAALAQQFANPRGLGATRGATGLQGVHGMVVDHDRYYKALQGLMAGEEIDGIKPFGSFKEAYCRWNGIDAFDFDAFEAMRNFGGQYDSHVDHARIQESVTTAQWNQIYADVFYLQVMRTYAASPYYDQWRMLISELENVPDFQTRHWARIGGYPDLPTVAENGTYEPMTTPTDEEVTYSISKRGGIDDITFEAIVGDRVGKIRAIPTAMGRTAARTLYKFVFDLVTTKNPTMPYDSVALYNATHGNGPDSAALSLHAVDLGIAKMRNQTAYDESSEILGPRNLPKFCIVPHALTLRAQRVFNPSSSYLMHVTADTDTAIDPEAFKPLNVQVLTYDQLDATSATGWYMIANPAEVETMVIGFLDGAQQPELFVQDQPNVGANFTAYRVSYKIRHSYGGAILD